LNLFRSSVSGCMGQATSLSRRPRGGGLQKLDIIRNNTLFRSPAMNEGLQKGERIRPRRRSAIAQLSNEIEQLVPVVSDPTSTRLVECHRIGVEVFWPDQVSALYERLDHHARGNADDHVGPLAEPGCVRHFDIFRK